MVSLDPKWLTSGFFVTNPHPTLTQVFKSTVTTSPHKMLMAKVGDAKHKKKKKIKKTVQLQL